MPRKTAGKLLPRKVAKSAKQIAAATKTILNYEKVQAYKNRVSDNLEVFFMGFVTGFAVCFIAALISVSIALNV